MASPGYPRLMISFVVCPAKMGFASTRQRNRHFQDHGVDFGAGTPEQYEQMAETFLMAPIVATLIECRRPQGEYYKVRSTDGNLWSDRQQQRY